MEALPQSRWVELVGAQQGIIARRQFEELGLTRSQVRAQVNALRWVWRTESVLSISTGPTTWHQRLWIAVLHASPGSLIGGLSAMTWHGLRGWDRAEVTVLVHDDLSFAPVPGIRFFRTRRPLPDWRAAGELPVARPEEAALLFAAYERNRRTAHGLLAAACQQRITTADRLAHSLVVMQSLRRKRELGQLLTEIAGGADSVAEIDLRRACRRRRLHAPAAQTPRRDRSGRRRWTDYEWHLPDGRVLVLEVDGAFHDDVVQASADKRRTRRLTSATRTVIACSAFELKFSPDDVIDDLIALGVPLS